MKVGWYMFLSNMVLIAFAMCRLGAMIAAFVWETWDSVSEAVEFFELALVPGPRISCSGASVEDERFFSIENLGNLFVDLLAGGCYCNTENSSH